MLKNNRKLLIAVTLVMFAFYGQAQKISGYSPDSLIRFLSFEPGETTTKWNWSDSCTVIHGPDSITLYPTTEACFGKSRCDTMALTDLMMSPCMVFHLPRLTRCVLLEDDLYALIGYTTESPSHVKHIWIVSLKNGLEIINRIGIITQRTLDNGIEFSYDTSNKEIIIHSNDVALREHQVYRYGDCYVNQQDISFNERKHYHYKIWIKNENESHLLTGKQVEVRVKL